MLLGLLLALQIIVAVALIGVILLQRSEGGALGMGGGPSGFMTARGAGDLLTRTTGILAGIFFALSLILTIVTGHSRGAGSVVDRLKPGSLSADALNNSQAQTSTTAPADAAPPPVVPGALPPGQAAPQPSAPSVFEAPKPQVNTAPANIPSVRTAPPSTQGDAGARNPAASTLGVQTAPTAPQPAPAR